MKIRKRTFRSRLRAKRSIIMIIYAAQRILKTNLRAKFLNEIGVNKADLKFTSTLTRLENAILIQMSD